MKLTKDEVRWIGSLALLALLALGTTGCSRARSNAQIASDVQNRIRTDARMQMARVRVLATGGVVTLSGYVTSDDQRAATVSGCIPG
jgi:osmotically-inducible protein OsmY